MCNKNIKIIKIFINLALVLSLSSCGINNSLESDVYAVQQKTETLLVVAGGFASCPSEGIADLAMRGGKTSEMHAMIQKTGILERLAAETESRNILSVCFTGFNNLLSRYFQSLEGRYAWGTDPLEKGAEGTQSFEISQGEMLISSNFLAHVKSELANYIRTRTSQGVKVKLFLIGHSYGGYAAIHLAQYFTDNLVQLVTLDPISPISCQAKYLAGRIYRTLRLRHKGCREAPSDSYSLEITQNLIQSVRDSAGQKTWHNIYQRSLPWLHSGPIDFKSTPHLTNERIPTSKFESFLYRGDYHSQMVRNNEIWNQISGYFSGI